MTEPSYTDRLTRALSGAVASFAFRPPRQLLGADFVPIFLMHRIAQPAAGINGHTPEELDIILGVLRRKGFEFVSLGDVIEAIESKVRVPRNAVCFTMDDGYWDQAELAVPVFQAHQAPVTLFVVTDLLDGVSWPWDARIACAFQLALPGRYEVPFGAGRLELDLETAVSRLRSRRNFQDLCRRVSDDSQGLLIESLCGGLDVDLPETPPPHFRGMTWEMARNLERDGVVFGPHSRTHRILSRTSPDQTRAEITGSWRRLKEELKSPLKVLAWPVGRLGDYGLAECQLAASSGFRYTLSAADEYVQVRPMHTQEAESEYAVVLGRFGLPPSATEVLMITTGLQRVWSKLGNLLLRSRTGYDMPKSARRRLLMARLTEKFRSKQTPSPVDWSRVDRLVFVCKGNVCRSPYSAAKALSEGLPSSSCGLEANDTAPADGTAKRIALMRGLDLGPHVSRTFRVARSSTRDLYVVMEPEQGRKLRRELGGLPAQIVLLSDWLEPRLPEIPDPYGLSETMFCHVFSLIDQGILALKNDRLKHSKNGSGRPADAGRIGATSADAKVEART